MRGPGANNETAERLEQVSAVGVEYGIVGCTHAGGVDRPLVAYKTAGGNSPAVVVPHMNWRGLFSMGTTPSGAASPVPVEWPGFRTTAYHSMGETQAITKNWMGSLLEEQRDAGGLLYKRNRYYDPATGQFTQADPVGLAGGLNTYGFAAGDPVSYADPYGLSPFDCITNPTLACKVGHAITRFFFGPPPDPGSKSGELASPGMADPVAAVTGAAATRMVVGRSLGTGAVAGAIAQRGASETGEHIVLGLADSGLERTAAAVGGRHLMGDANWRTTFMAAVGNPRTTITVSLDGLSGSSTYQQVMGAVQRGAAGQAGHTNWELAQLWQAGRLGTVHLVRSVGTKIERVPNPFECK